jgi:hypothetical protein
VSAPNIRGPGEASEVSADDEEHLGEMARMAWWLVWLESHESWWARQERWRREARSQ